MGKMLKLLFGCICGRRGRGCGCIHRGKDPLPSIPSEVEECAVEANQELSDDTSSSSAHSPSYQVFIEVFSGMMSSLILSDMMWSRELDRRLTILLVGKPESRNWEETSSGSQRSGVLEEVQTRREGEQEKEEETEEQIEGHFVRCFFCGQIYLAFSIGRFYFCSMRCWESQMFLEELRDKVVVRKPTATWMGPPSAESTMGTKIPRRSFSCVLPAPSGRSAVSFLATQTGRDSPSETCQRALSRRTLSERFAKVGC